MELRDQEPILFFTAKSSDQYEDQEVLEIVVQAA